METLLQQLVGGEVLERVASAATQEERTQALLQALPEIQTNLRAMPDADRTALLAHQPAEMQQMAGLAVRAFVAADVEDLSTIVETVAPQFAAAAGSREAGATADLDRPSPMMVAANVLNEPKALTAVHRVIVKCPDDVRADATPLLPEPARPIVEMAAELDSDEFVEIASGVAETLAPPAPPPSVPVAANDGDGGGSATAAPPSPAWLGHLAPGGTTGAASGGSDGGGGAADWQQRVAGMLRIGKAVGRTQIRLQLAYIEKHLASGDARALSLVGGAIGAVYGLLNTLGRALTLHLICLPLALTLLGASAIIFIVEADGALAATAARGLLRRLPALRHNVGRATVCLAAGYAGVLAGPAILSPLCAPLFVAAALNLLNRRTVEGAAAGDSDGGEGGDAHGGGGVGGGGENRAEEPAPLKPTYYGFPREAAVVGGPDDAAPQLQEALKSGPPTGGWEVQRASAVTALCAAAAAAASLVAALRFSLGGLDVLRFAAAVVALACAGCLLSIDLAQLPSPVGPRARAMAVPLLRGWPPLSLAVSRAAALLGVASAVGCTLPEKDGGGAARAAYMLMLVAMALGIYAISLSWRLALTLYVDGTLTFLGRSSKNETDETMGASEEEVRALLASSQSADDPSSSLFIEACVALDLDRDGEVGKDDLDIFYGRRGEM